MSWLNGKQGNNDLAATPLPPRQPKSHRFASAVEEFKTLEDELICERERADEEERRALLAEGERDRLAAELDRVKHERDAFQQRCIAMRSKLTVSGKIILDVLQEEKIDEERYAPDALRAVEGALIETKSPPSLDAHTETPHT